MADQDIDEIWRLIPTHPDYAVSNMGRVRRETDIIWTTRYGTTATIAAAGRILRPGLGSHGYLGVALGRQGHHLVHRLVVQAFLPQITGKTHVNHINGIKTDNRLANVEWSNKSLNQIHAMKIGLYAGPPHRPGMAQGSAKLTDDDVRQIRLKRAAGLHYRVIAAEYGVSQSLAFYVCKKGWKHIA